MITGFGAYKEYLDDRVKCYPFMQEIILFYKGLIDIWNDAQPDDLSPLLVPERLAKRLSMLDIDRIEHIDFKKSAATAKKVFMLIGRKKREETKGMENLTEEGMVNLIKEGLSRKDRYKNPPLKWILKPSFGYTLEIVNPSISSRDEKEGAWTLGLCPVCYSPPGMALIKRMTRGEAEKRYLSCCFCGYQWPFDRVACPRCGNDKADKQGFFVGESSCDQGTRGESCEECKTYLKTIYITCREDNKDIKDIRDLDMDIEDVATIPLDIIADQRGYTALCQQTTTT